MKIIFRHVFIRLFTVLVASGVFFIVSCSEKPDSDNGGKETEKEEIGTDPLDDIPDGFVEEPSDGTADVDGVFTYGRLSSMGHPRLLMTSHDFAVLKHNLSGENALDYISLFQINKLILENADAYVEDPSVIKVKLDASGKRNLDMSKLALKRLFNCAYAYRITGKDKYLNKVKADLGQVCKMETWHPSHYLDVGEMAFGVAVAYDWAYWHLDYKTRTAVREKLDEYCLQTAPGQSFYNNKGNWNEVCNAGVMAAAIVTYEQNRARSRKAIEDGVASNAAALEAMYSPDGNYSEGYGYWSYGTGYETVILQMLKVAFGHTAGLERIPGFSKTAEFMLYMVGPSGEDFSYSDGGSNSMRPMYPVWWFAANQNNPSLLVNEFRMLDLKKYPSATSSDAAYLPAIPCFIKDFKFNKAAASNPKGHIWVGKGRVPVAMVRSSWTWGTDDFYFGIKGGGCTAGHAHMDAGAFVFDALGLRWSEDYQRPNYADMEVKTKAAGGDFWATGQKSLRWDILKMNNYGHSTLSFLTNDGSVSKLHATDQIAGGSATIDAVYSEDPDALGVRMNLSSCYSDAAASVYRTIRLLKGHSLEIKDEITAKPGMDATPEWRMNTPCLENTVEDGRILMLQEGKTMILTTSSSSGASPVLAVWEGKRPSNWTDRPGWDSGLSCRVVGWDAVVPAGKTVTFTTIITPKQ